MLENAKANDRLYSRKESARFLTEKGLEISAQTLARKFHEGTGPMCTHAGRRAMYRQSDLDAWFAAQLTKPRRSSSEPRKPAYAEAPVIHARA